MLSSNYSLHLVDPELRDFLSLWPMQHISAENLISARQLLGEVVDAQMAAMQMADAAPFVKREQRELPGAFGESTIRGIIHSPVAEAPSPRPAYFHLHGGGYVMGCPELMEERVVKIVEANDCVVVSPAYRVAPETKFPGAVEDCYAALEWVFQHAEEIGIDQARIVIGGESAGGGLAASLALLARDRGEIEVAGQLLVYPMIDDRTGSSIEPSRFSGEYLWTAEFNRFGWSCLLDCEPGTDGVSKYAAAAREIDLSGLPPAAILVGALDLFVNENIEYARRLIAAGIRTMLRVYPGAYHGFDMAGETRLGVMFDNDYNNALFELLNRRY